MQKLTSVFSQNSTLDCREYGNALEALRGYLPTVPRQDIRGFFTRAAELSEELPVQMREALADFRANGNEDGYLLIRGLPVDQSTLPPTPDHWRVPVERPLLQMEAWIALIGMRMGVATGYAENRGGAVFQDVFPARDKEAMTAAAHSMSAHGHEAMLRWHTEMAYLQEQPNYLAIGCSRADHDRVAKTPIVSIRKIISKLSEEHREILRTVPLPWHVDAAFQSEADPDPMTNLLLLSDNDDILCYDGGLIIPEEVEKAGEEFGYKKFHNENRAKEFGRKTREALETFTEMANEMATELYLEPGDIVLIDNLRTAHARTRFKPRWDSPVNDNRWLNRIFIRTPGVGHDPELEHAEVVRFKIREPHQPR
ncbi:MULTISPECIES: TauD/TfdA family dioxygenase [Paenibacillus]|uniref:TauD/TfdA family dioxygenase n=1 Tax=Paenibacillus TaxID=44249 RepID=UPI0004B82249|nr:TauD/TfdA family dioxygenase [Paenibacillus sp. IHBB 10380]